jgi:hypothetical protein
LRKFFLLQSFGDARGRRKEKLRYFVKEILIETARLIEVSEEQKLVDLKSA